MNATRNVDAAATGIATASEPTVQQETEKGKFVTTVSPAPEVAPPPGADPDMWTGNVRDVYTQVGFIALSADLLRCPTVTLVAEQFRDGRLGCVDIVLDVAMGRSDAGLSIPQARELAGLLTAAADLAEGWVQR